MISGDPIKAAQDFVSRTIHPLDDIENWGQDFTFQPPMSHSIVERWQKRFDDTFGLNKRGKPCFKLVWSGDRKYWHDYFWDWDSYGKGTKLEQRPLVLWKKVNLPNGDYVDLFPPRWLILSRIEPEQYADNWKRESWVMDAKRGPVTINPLNGELMRAGQMKQIRPDNPPEDFWQVWEVLGEHDAFCCEAMQGDCYGSYREPKEKDVDNIGLAKRDFEAGGQSPYEGLSKWSEAEIASFARAYYRQQYKDMDASVDITVEHADNFLAPILARTGESYSDREKKTIVKNALDQYHTERQEELEQILRSE